KVNATLPKELKPEDVTLEKALELIAAKGGPKKAAAKKAPAKKAAAPKKAATKKPAKKTAKGVSAEA
ncbi:MAG TPA: topoisomerase C-terminal repeat-containing protein, partial [Devosia sp.]|nr:topoisomerase C-terminal repeat-containing protein [Devosia sp.]